MRIFDQKMFLHAKVGRKIEINEKCSIAWAPSAFPLEFRNAATMRCMPVSKTATANKQGHFIRARIANPERAGVFPLLLAHVHQYSGLYDAHSQP